MKPIQQNKDPRITNLTLDNFTGSIYIITTEINENDDDDKEKFQSMLTSPRTNSVDHFVPNHHLSLITQPVLGARSRSRKKSIDSIKENSTIHKDKLHSMSNIHRRSYDDSPPLIDQSQYQKAKINSNSHRESADSGLDLSSSTTSSIQFQQYSQSHTIGHRPLSALNEDSSPDDGYYDDQQQQQQQTSQSPTRLRFPPVNFGRNRSMEDMLGTNKREHHQQRSGSFTDEHQLKVPLRHDYKMKRSSDGALLDLIDTPRNSYRRANAIKTELLYPSMSQHRSLNDLIDKSSNRVSRNESNMSTNVNNLSLPQTVIRKPNTTTLKPLRKKTKLNIIIEPAVPLTSSRLAIYDEQINALTGATSSSSSQTTPRSIQPTILQQQIKSKLTSTSLGYYANPEQVKAHVNRSVVERQHPPIPPVRRGPVLQQLVPFDASPSKVNKLLRHHVHQQQQQPPITFHPISHTQLSPSRQTKQTSHVLLSNDETLSNIDDEKRKQIKFELVEKQRFKQKNGLDNNKLVRRLKDHNEKSSIDQNVPRYFTKTTQRQVEKFPKKKILQNRFIENIDQRQPIETFLTSSPRHQYETPERRFHINELNRRGSGQSNSITGKSQDNKIINQRNHGYQLDPLRIYETKSTELHLKNQAQSHTNEKKIKQNELHSQYGINHSYDTQTQSNRNLNEHQIKTTSKTVRIQPILSTNIYPLQREREISRLSNNSQPESIQSKQQIHGKESTVSFQSRSPTSWAVLSEHQQKLESLQDENHLDEPSHTYRLVTIDHEQSLDEKYVIPTTNSHVSSLIDHTYPFTFTPDSEINDAPDETCEKSNLSVVYAVSERDSTHKTMNYHSPPPPPKVMIATDKDDIPSNYDSDDGWSDDSAELLYVDERYAKEKRKNPSSTHLSTQKHYHYQVQQQNVLL
ncbi:hypothetical protein I4U23_006225 [Adineta vaga]|nr:hypothetical protein I4U23_006225 [Adineta vaga]